MRFGWRARIGHIQPAGSIEAGEEWRRVAPEGVTFIEARTILTDVSEEGLAAMMEQVLRATEEIRWAQPNVVMQVGSPGVFLRGVDYEREIIAEMERIAGVPCTTMMTTTVDGLKAIGAQRLALATYYTDAFNAKLQSYLEGFGFKIASIIGMQETRVRVTQDLMDDVSYRLAREAYKKAGSADAIGIICGGLRTFQIIDYLERDTGVPVITSNQAALWRILQMAGVSTEGVSGLGTLFRLGSDEPLRAGIQATDVSKGLEGA